MMSDISLPPSLTDIYLEYYQLSVIIMILYLPSYSQVTVLCTVLIQLWDSWEYHFGNFPSSFLFLFSFFHLFPSFLIGLVGLLPNYSSFSHDKTEDLSGNCFHGFTCSLLSFFFHIQFKDQLVIFKTFFPVLMRRRQLYPKSIIAVHYASNRKWHPLTNHLFTVSCSLTQYFHFPKVLTLKGRGIKNPTCVPGSFSLQPVTSS